MGLSKEEAAYLAKAMANKEQACVPFGNKNDAAYFAQVCKENDVFAAALSDGNDNGYIVFVKEDLKKLQDCVPQFSEVMTTLKNREIAELLAKGKPLPSKPPKGFKLVKNMPDLPHTENTREPDRDTRNTPPEKDSIGETPTSNHSEQVVHDLANDPYNHTALIRDKVLAAREQCRDLEDFKAILAENGIGTRLNDDGELQFYEGRQGKDGEILKFDKDMDWPVNAKTLAGEKYQCDATLDWFEKNTPKEPSGIDSLNHAHSPIPPQKDLNLICNSVRSDLEERGIQTLDRADGKMGFVVDQKYKQDVIKAVEARFPGLTPEELGIEFDDGRNDPPNPPTPPAIDGSLDTDGRTPSLDQNIKSHDGMDTDTKTLKLEREQNGTDISPSMVRGQSDRSRESYNFKSKADENSAASKQLSPTNDSHDRDISDKFQQER